MSMMWCSNTALSCAAGTLLPPDLDRGASNLASAFRICTAGAPIRQLGQQCLTHDRFIWRDAKDEVIRLHAVNSSPLRVVNSQFHVA